MALFKTDFVGTGPAREFVAEVVKLFELLNNINLIKGPDYHGDEIEFGIVQNGKSYSLVLKINNLTNVESR